MVGERVNPPTWLKLPPKVAADSQLKKAFDDRDFIMFQLWKRSGGSTDTITTITEESDGIVVNRALSVRPSQVFNIQSQIDGANDRIEANELDLATRPRMSDLFKTNQRINELIDELIEQLDKLNVGSEAQQQAVCLQVETLKQIKLLNIRTEEAFDTKINKEDIE